MIASPEQLAAVYADFGDPSDGWADSLSLEPLLCAAHDQGVLDDVWVYQLLDDEQDEFLVSVELHPGLTVHAPPTRWSEVRPAAEMQGAMAVGHVLRQLFDITMTQRAVMAEYVRAAGGCE